jgi:hypothetical protein
VVFGVVLMVIVLLIPGGVASLFRRMTRPVKTALARRA